MKSDLPKFDKDLLSFLKENKKARERLYKSRTVAHIMRKKHPRLNEIPLDVLEDYVVEICKLDRQWRRILQLEPSLRGLDYDYKKKAEQKEKIKLGYESGYYSDSKKLSKLTGN